MKVRFVAGFGPLVRDARASLSFYRDVLGLPLVGDADYVAMDGFDGIKFDVESPEAVAGAARELEAAGYPLLVGPTTEPWNQTVVRLLGPEGMLVTISYTPWLHGAG